MNPRAQCTPTRQENPQFGQAGGSSIKSLLTISIEIGHSSKQQKEEHKET